MQKTKKKKSHNLKRKKELWDSFEKTFQKDEEEHQQRIECLYSNQKPENRSHCELCRNLLAFSEEGFLVCTNNQCGIIYKDMLDASAEWRYYGADDNKSSDPTRCGMPIDPLLKKSSYGCKVICGYRSSYEMRKIRRYTEWQSMPYEEKSKYDEFQKIRILAGTHGISKCIIDEALVQYQKISTLKTFRGCNRNGIIAASIYLACRINEYPRTAKEIATIFNLDNTNSTKGCKIATHLLNGLETNVASNNKTKFDDTKPIAFIDRFCSKLNMNKELTKVCQFVAFRIDSQKIIPENTPHSVAAGIVYFVSQACKLNVSKRDVNLVSEISEVTINKCYKKLNKIKTNLIPSVILKKYSSI